MAEQQKRISNALKIWEKVCPTHKEWKLQIVGDGPDLAYYKRIVGKNGITNVEFIGHSENVEEYYKKAKYL